MREDAREEGLAEGLEQGVKKGIELGAEQKSREVVESRILKWGSLMSKLLVLPK